MMAQEKWKMAYNVKFSNLYNYSYTLDNTHCRRNSTSTHINSLSFWSVTFAWTWYTPWEEVRTHKEKCIMAWGHWYSWNWSYTQENVTKTTTPSSENVCALWLHMGLCAHNIIHICTHKSSVMYIRRPCSVATSQHVNHAANATSWMATYHSSSSHPLLLNGPWSLIESNRIYTYR